MLFENQNQNEDILSEVEHNRWNMERLLLGTEPVCKEQRQQINDMLMDPDPEVVKTGKEMKNHLQEHFHHKDIAPYDQLLQSSKQYDTAIVTNILDVMRDV